MKIRLSENNTIRFTRFYNFLRHLGVKFPYSSIFPDKERTELSLHWSIKPIAIVFNVLYPIEDIGHLGKELQNFELSLAKKSKIYDYERIKEAFSNNDKDINSFSWNNLGTIRNQALNNLELFDSFSFRLYRFNDSFALLRINGRLNENTSRKLEESVNQGSSKSKFLVITPRPTLLFNHWFYGIDEHYSPSYQRLINKVRQDAENVIKQKFTKSISLNTLTLGTYNLLRSNKSVKDIARELSFIGYSPYHYSTANFRIFTDDVSNISLLIKKDQLPEQADIDDYIDESVYMVIWALFSQIITNTKIKTMHQFEMFGIKKFRLKDLIKSSIVITDERYRLSLVKKFVSNKKYRLNFIDSSYFTKPKWSVPFVGKHGINLIDKLYDGLNNFLDESTNYLNSYEEKLNRYISLQNIDSNQQLTKSANMLSCLSICVAILGIILTLFGVFTALFPTVVEDYLCNTNIVSESICR